MRIDPWSRMKSLWIAINISILFLVFMKKVTAGQGEAGSFPIVKTIDILPGGY